MPKSTILVYVWNGVYLGHIFVRGASISGNCHDGIFTVKTLIAKVAVNKTDPVDYYTTQLSQVGPCILDIAVYVPSHLPYLLCKFTRQIKK